MSADTKVNIEHMHEKDAIVELVNEGYDDLIDDVGDWEQGYSVVDVLTIDEGRWQMFMKSIIQAPSGNYFSVDWARGLTEYQEQGPFEHTGVEPVEVARVEKKITTIEWQQVKT